VVLATTRAPTTMAPTPAPVDNAAMDDNNAVAWSATSPTAATSGIDNEVVDDVDDEGASSKSEPTPSGIVRPVVGGKEEGATSVRGGVGSDDETPEDETPGGTKEGSSERPDGESSLVASSDGGTTTKDDDDEEDEASGNSTIRADDEGDDDGDDDDGILSLDATVRIALSNLPSTMHPDAQYIFETMCSEFLNDQLTYATPPIFDVECIVVGQSLEEDDRRRNRRDRRLRRHRESVVAPQQHHHHPHGSSSSSSSSLRYLASSTTHSRLTVEAQITGSVETTQPSARRMNDDKFATLLIGTFNVQGYIFAEMLKEAEENEATNFESNSTTATVATATTFEYYRTVGEVRGMEVDGVASGEGDYDDDADDDGGDTVFTKGVVAAIGVGGVIVALVSMVLFARKARRRRGEKKGRGTAVAGGKSGVRRSGVVGGGAGGGGARKSNPGNGASAVATRRKVAEPSSLSSSSAANNIPSMKTIPSTSPTNTTSTSASSPTFTSTSSTTGTTTKTNTNTNTNTKLPSPRVRREVLAPAGKLGIMVANAKGIAGRGGPTVHTIRPGSPMEGMIYVNDVIVGVNDVDTRTFTANDMTRLMKDTAGEGRRIYVLSSARR